MKDDPKAWRTVAQDHLKQIPRKSGSLKEKYKELKTDFFTLNLLSLNHSYARHLIIICFPVLVFLLPFLWNISLYLL